MNKKDHVIRGRYEERATRRNHDLLDQCIKLRFELRYTGWRDIPQISKGHLVLGRDCPASSSLLGL